MTSSTPTNVPPNADEANEANEANDSDFVLLAGGLAELATQKPVRDGSVSPHRTYSGEHVRIRHLAFDAGVVLAEHSAPRPVVIIVVEGEVLFTVGTDTHRLSAGAVLHLDQGISHSVTAVETSRLVLTLVV
ncbi:MAG: cupin domain-containing protein [Brevibacterium aurantiacum]